MYLILLSFVLRQNGINKNLKKGQSWDGLGVSYEFLRELERRKKIQLIQNDSNNCCPGIKEIVPFYVNSMKLSNNDKIKSEHKDPMKRYNPEQLQSLKMNELKDIAKEFNIEVKPFSKKSDLIEILAGITV